jgi:hypothetical protein
VEQRRERHRVRHSVKGEIENGRGVAIAQNFPGRLNWHPQIDLNLPPQFCPMPAHDAA